MAKREIPTNEEVKEEVKETKVEKKEEVKETKSKKSRVARGS